MWLELVFKYLPFYAFLEDDEGNSCIWLICEPLGQANLSCRNLFRYDWDAATTMGFLKNYGLSGTNSTLSSIYVSIYPYIYTYTHTFVTCNVQMTRFGESVCVRARVYDYKSSPLEKTASEDLEFRISKWKSEQTRISWSNGFAVVKLRGIHRNGYTFCGFLQMTTSWT